MKMQNSIIELQNMIKYKNSDIQRMEDSIKLNNNSTKQLQSHIDITKAIIEDYEAAIATLQAAESAAGDPKHG
jgi:hypothetical protein